jgi:uncharacterized membrane protein ArfB
MDFVIQWLWYLLAFLAGSAAARVLAAIWVKRLDREEVPPVPVYEVYPK